MTLTQQVTTYNWRRLTPGNLPPTNELVMTKIDDEKGVRNEQALTFRQGRWWDNRDIYTYYTPTHWAYMSGI